MTKRDLGMVAEGQVRFRLLRDRKTNQLVLQMISNDDVVEVTMARECAEMLRDILDTGIRECSVSLPS